MTPVIGEERIERLELTVSDKGPWVADCSMERDPVLQGQQTITMGDTDLVGTVVSTGIFGGRTTCQIVAGKATWSKVCTVKNYQLDQGVRTVLLWEDLLRDIGETAGSFVPQSERIGLAFVRNAVKASTVLESFIGSAKWWVDYDGRTYVGQRASTSPKNYEVLAYDPSEQTVQLALDDIEQLRVGSVLTERLPAPLSVLSYRITVSSEGIRATCQALQDMPALLRSIIQHEIERSVSPLRKYRVVGMTGDGRVDLQIAQKATGFPDLGKVSMWPGVAGAHAELTKGTEVIVGFIDGDRSQPIIVGFVGKGGAGHGPVKLTFSSPVDIKGALTADGEITAKNALASTKVTLTGHKHPSGTGPTGKPIVPEVA
jgi:hypothetical protein